MSRTRGARTSIERDGSERARRVRWEVSNAISTARHDAGLSLRSLARASGISGSTLLALERGLHDPSTEVLARVGVALGMELSVKLYPGMGPVLRDHLQAPMVEALIAIANPRWQPSPEVIVKRPVRGVIDLVLESPEPPLVAVEAQSQLRRLEQQVRWSRGKADALATVRSRPVARLLLLRSTRQTRALAIEFAATLGAAYPASSAEAYAALVDEAPWPGDAILWCDIRAGRVTVLLEPPRHVTVGR